MVLLVLLELLPEEAYLELVTSVQDYNVSGRVADFVNLLLDSRIPRDALGIWTAVSTTTCTPLVQVGMNVIRVEESHILGGGG